jgi:hypothetical protein
MTYIYHQLYSGQQLLAEFLGVKSDAGCHSDISCENLHLSCVSWPVVAARIPQREV